MLGSADTNAILSHVQDSKISNGFVYQSKNIKLLLAISVRRQSCCKCILLKSRGTDRHSYGISYYYHPLRRQCCCKCILLKSRVMVYHTITLHQIYIFLLMGNVKILQKAGLQL